MKKFYYFSEKSLNFLEIKHFKEKAAAVLIVSVLLLSSILFGVFYLVSNLSNKDDYIQSLKKENELLKGKYLSLTDQYVKLESDLTSLTKLSNDLRLAVNLEPISVEQRKLGVGGSTTISKLYSGLGSDISDAIDVADKVLKKFEFEKIQYDEITSKLKMNKNLFESIPAIVPADGNYSSESYGMRMHPILHVYKMHTGIDIITDVGTSVKATGKGKVIFVGPRSGYGLAIEIDHGFGYQTIYAHLSSINVKEGSIVKRNQVIAKSGNSGLSSGPHLHYEVLHNGQTLNPSEFFFDEYSYFESSKSN
ncbi:MAG: M23 family metallopeptidase [Ignavibacteriaceae bacterium]|nr:M23 family metallopeptidase [Ignavibacteriaceae bacterium]HRN25089.1 M23 family metallopeptidase [Ignavibacteriaceae bacterium]HRQ54329.1 M23 family metallopeptidase [Ignavibacteriaceae bacterium]